PKKEKGIRPSAKWQEAAGFDSLAIAARYSLDIVIAFAGQSIAQSEQRMQSPGRGSQTTAPAISRQSAGHSRTQSPQPVQWVSSRRGSSSAQGIGYGLGVCGRSLHH